MNGVRWAQEAFDALKAQGEWWRSKPVEERQAIEAEMSKEQARYNRNARIKRRLEKVA
jgi:hypothetical protein